ncbi:polysaccharide biosynthesis/export family protein [Methylophaga sulfidovorans]|uniref:Polysaccharide export outer membrane protein n=1 Tax=Methylophaga sulfidovorans TaxID=45496 RepID=A0A1I3XM42_9GAMM|nr:polysaccharide biosynthesis/export family protein [Methylophaga sulfidovorans]SFK20570.1 polysaccharide export outer membrane protein [Methylophaga sulfidovorans]
MSKRFLLFFIVVVSLFSSTVFAAERYLLNSGDVLDISVWNEESLQKQVTVLPDGVITFPLAGEVVAKDKTVAEVEEELTKKLSEYLADPVVTVSVTSVDGNRVHILGKVLNPGSFVMNQPLDAMQALSLAGGLSPYAEENNIIVLRRDGTKQQVLPVKYAEIKKGKALNTNITLESGDVIIVP